MAPSQSDSGGSFRVLLSGLLKSNHSLVLGLALFAILLFALARANYPIVAYGAASLVGVLVLVVAVRFAIKGPEAEHGPPAVTFAGNHFQLINFDSNTAESLVRFAIKNRKALPPPTGVIDGSAADFGAIRLLSTTDAAQMASADLSALPPPGDGAPLG